MKKPQRWLFRRLSMLVCVLLVVGASGLSSSLAVAAPVAASAAVPVAASAPVDSLSASSNTLLPNSSVQPAQQPLVTEPLTPTDSSSVTSPNQPDAAATIDQLLAPSAPNASCTVNPMQYATLLHKDEIGALGPSNGQTQYTQANNYNWSSVSTALSTGLTDPPAVIARDRVIEWVVNKSGTLYHGRTFPDRSSLTTASETSLGSPQPGGWGQPALVERTPFEMWTFIRGGGGDTHLYYKVWTQKDGWVSTWMSIPNVNDAGSIPAAVWHDTNHLEVFYKDSNNNVKFIEWALGEWMPRSIALRKQLSSDLTVISMNSNHVAVFGVDTSGSLWVRQWTADKQPDWSDANNWSQIDSGAIPNERPAAIALSGDQMVAAARKASPPSYDVIKYINANWNSPFVWLPGVATFTTPPTLAKSNANAYMVAGSTSSTSQAQVLIVDSNGSRAVSSLIYDKNRVNLTP